MESGVNIEDQNADFSITSNSGGDATIQSQTSIAINSNDISLESGQNLVTNATDTTTITSINGNIQLSTLDDDIILNSNNQINLTTTNNSINLNSGTSVNISTGGGEQVNITSSDNTNISSSGANVIINSNGTDGSCRFNTGDIVNGGGVYWNSFLMPISFTTTFDNGFNYPNGNPTDTWVNVFSQSIGFPTQFLATGYQITFNMNFFNTGSLPSDKQLAIYWVILDGNGTEYKGHTFTQDYPWANWFNPSQYTYTSQNPMPISYSDYFDLSSPSAINDLQLQLWWFGDQTNDYKIRANIQFIPTNRI